MRRGTLTVDQLVQRYCALVHAQTRSYRETARRLGIDRRTVMAKIGGVTTDQSGTDGEGTD